jgi:hypothetical protein
VIPYGIYDVGRNQGWVSVGIDHDASEFAIDGILGWWRYTGRKTYPQATKLLIMADAGGQREVEPRRCHGLRRQLLVIKENIRCSPSSQAALGLSTE